MNDHNDNAMFALENSINKLKQTLNDKLTNCYEKYKDKKVSDLTMEELFEIVDTHAYYYIKMSKV